MGLPGRPRMPLRVPAWHRLAWPLLRVSGRLRLSGCRKPVKPSSRSWLQSWCPHMACVALVDGAGAGGQAEKRQGEEGALRRRSAVRLQDELSTDGASKIDMAGRSARFAGPNRQLFRPLGSPAASTTIPFGRCAAFRPRAVRHGGPSWPRLRDLAALLIPISPVFPVFPPSPCRSPAVRPGAIPYAAHPVRSSPGEPT
ncbi:hypothetical protein G7Z17_g4766 [Cylindrodendrum hubeiense]|uniref:Uncharacterized protein n=1 Tax=Cylindrodendrum hubeiense TaxID=595255 RepID=A0A9P5HFJ0_9HYPO|nr:hypothetical protein G7Z17_g4766 [Cylindrodendrum hubeiense]